MNNFLLIIFILYIIFFYFQFTNNKKKEYYPYITTKKPEYSPYGKMYCPHGFIEKAQKSCCRLPKSDNDNDSCCQVTLLSGHCKTWKNK